MNITRINLDGNDPRLDPKPGAWGNLNNTGCGIPGCNCSPGYWITLRTNEGDIIMLTFTPNEADAIKSGDFDLRGGQVATGIAPEWTRLDATDPAECIRCASYVCHHQGHPAFKPIRDLLPGTDWLDGCNVFANALVCLNRKVMTDKYGLDHEGWPSFKFEHVDISEPEWVYATECWLYQTAEGNVPTSNKLWLAIDSAVIDTKNSPSFDDKAYGLLKNSEYWV